LLDSLFAGISESHHGIIAALDAPIETDFVIPRRILIEFELDVRMVLRTELELLLRRGPGRRDGRRLTRFPDIL
jgi:hypothetical protein